MYDVFFAIKSIDIFFILIISILCFSCLFFLSIIKKLKDKITDLELENKNILERKVMKQNNVDLISLQNISKEKENLKSEKKLEKSPSISSTNSTKSLENISKSMDVKKNKQEAEVSFNQNHFIKNNIVAEKNTVQKESNFSMNKAYQKNVLQNKNRVISPVSISLEDSFDRNQFSFDLNEFVKKSEKVVPKIREQSSRKDYLKELSDQMANELKPQTIELTDYEKEQEEHAIISYQELLSVKDQLGIADDEKETIDFLDDLKNLRNRLN